MNATIESSGPSVLTDEKIIAALKNGGPLTIEEMSSMPEMSWVRVFSSVDRLSRIGVVSLRKIGLAYQVVYSKTILSQPIVFPKTLAATAEAPLQRA